MSAATCRRPLPLLVLVLALGALALPATASGAVVTVVNGDVLRVAADPGERLGQHFLGLSVQERDTTADPDTEPDVYDISDSGDNVDAPPECSQESANSVRCPSGGIVAIHVEGGTVNDPNTTPEGDNVSVSGSDPVVMNGNAGNDELQSTGVNPGGPDEINGGLGDDLLEGGPGTDRLDGGDGVDDVFGGEGEDTVFGGPGNDHNVSGDEGNDQLVDGGDGDDKVSGEDGDDLVRGGEGNDTVFGDRSFLDDQPGGGTDTVDGGAGDDELIGGYGADTVNGGDGTDFASYSNRNNVFTERTIQLSLNGVADDGEDTDGDGFVDELDNVDADGLVENLRGQKAGPVNLIGNDEPNVLDGHSTSSTLIEGGAGDDDIVSEAAGDDPQTEIDAGPGSDTVDAGAAKSVVLGGTGDDTVDAPGRASDVTGGTGTDTIRTGGEDDTIHEQEGEFDTVACGGGNDTAELDTNDAVDADPAQACENQLRPAAPPGPNPPAPVPHGPAPPGPAPPGPVLPVGPTVAQLNANVNANAGAAAGAMGAQRIPKILAAGGVNVRNLPILAAGRLDIGATANAPAPRRLRAGAAARVTVASVRRTITRAGRYTVKLKLTPAGRRLLRRVRRLTVTVTVTFRDSRGRTTKRTKTARLRR